MYRDAYDLALRRGSRGNVGNGPSKEQVAAIIPEDVPKNHPMSYAKNVQLPDVMPVPTPNTATKSYGHEIKNVDMSYEELANQGYNELEVSTSTPEVDYNELENVRKPQASKH